MGGAVAALLVQDCTAVGNLRISCDPSLATGTGGPVCARTRLCFSHLTHLMAWLGSGGWWWWDHTTASRNSTLCRVHSSALWHSSLCSPQPCCTWRAGLRSCTVAWRAAAAWRHLTLTGFGALCSPAQLQTLHPSCATQTHIAHKTTQDRRESGKPAPAHTRSRSYTLTQRKQTYLVHSSAGGTGEHERQAGRTGLGPAPLYRWRLLPRPLVMVMHAWGGKHRHCAVLDGPVNAVLLLLGWLAWCGAVIYQVAWLWGLLCGRGDCV